MPYAVPGADIAAIIDTPPPPAASVSPDGRWVLLVHYESHPPIALLARPFRSLGGIRIDPKLWARRRTLRIRRLTLLEVTTGAERQIEAPDQGLSVPQWSADSRRFAFTVDTEDHVDLWIGSAETATAGPVGIRLNDVLTGGQLGGDGPYRWSRDSRSILALTLPLTTFPPDVWREPEPRVSETAGKRSQMATYADLLTSDADGDEFEVWATSQLVRISGEPGNWQTEPLGEPATWMSGRDSPDGRWLLVERLKRPYSQRVPYHYFARSKEIWTSAGEPVRVVADLPVSDEVPPKGVPTGPRQLGFLEAEPATLWWVEALDGGDPAVEAEHRDRLLELQAPWTAEPREWHRLADRCNAFYRLDVPGEGLVVTVDPARRWVSLFRLSSADEQRNSLVWERDRDDVYADKGDPVSLRSPDGRRTVVEVDGRILVTGDGPTPDGNRPVTGLLDLATGEVTELFRSDLGEQLELVAPATGVDTVVVRHQTAETPPYLVLLDLNTGERRPLTHTQHPHPVLQGAVKRVVRCTREDGVPASGLLHLPPGYEPERDGPLPLVFWAYPEDYSDARTAGQVRTSPGAFTRLTALQPVWFTLRGWAVLNQASVAVVGDPQTMNDTFVEQITAAARAHIDNLVAEGIVDPARVVVGGHSYGAFMAANLLAHTEFFAGGIARSGAYNRTLTPFGFQHERRSFWSAPAAYDTMSPFRFADRITDPLLLVHGERDENSGTYPLQSERLFAAIQATGGRARLVVLPHEGHGYLARESVLHVLAEQFDWAEKATS